MQNSEGSVPYFFCDQFGSRLARNQGRRDDNVNLTALLHEEPHFGFDELLGHFLRISTLPGSFLFDVHFDEFGS